MEQLALLNEIKKPDLDYFFDIKFDGNSFDGVMNIKDLSLELKSLDICLNKIIPLVIAKNKLAINTNEYQILVGAFQNNCFKKRIKLFLLEDVERHPVLVAGVIAIFIEFMKIVPLFYNQNNKITPELIAEVKSEVVLSLLNDKEFRVAASNSFVNPLKNSNDKVTILPHSDLGLEELNISYSDKDKYFEDTSFNNEIENDDKKQIEKEIIREDSIFGKIVAMDIDAPVRQIDFKIYGENRRVYGTLADGLDIQDYKKYLGEFVEIKGVITESEGIVKSMLIQNIEKSEEPGQKEMLEKY